MKRETTSAPCHVTVHSIPLKRKLERVMGRKEPAHEYEGFPGFGMKIMLAVRQSSGMYPREYDAWERIFRYVSAGLGSFWSMIGRIASGPADL